MIDFEPVWQAIRAWLITATGLPDGQVIFADPNPNAPRPRAPFVTVKQLGAMRRLGACDEERLGAEAGFIQRIGHRRLTVDVNVYGPRALALAAAAQDHLERYDVRLALDAVGLTVIDRGQLNNLTALLDTQYEQRGQFEAVFGLAVGSTEDVGWIETVEYEGAYNVGGDPPVIIETNGTIGGA